jgi:toxin CptA
MSIAVSVIVKPSRLLLLTVGGMCLAVIAAAMTAVALAGELPPLSRLLIAFFGFFLAFFGFYHTARNRKALHIDISGTGQLRVKEMASFAGSCQEQNWPHVNDDVEVVRLMGDSTIWPHLLLLRLQSEGGEIKVVRVLHDSISRDGFRALSVACRWIAAHNSPRDHKNL